MSNLYVVARIRPLTPEESNENTRQYITIRKNELILFSGKHISSGTVADHRVQTRIFTLDHIFGSCESNSSELDSQSSLYNHIGKDAVESVKHGYNSSVFAYGMTGTGKTHTIFGSEKDPGLIPRVCDALLEHVKLNQSIHMKYDLKIRNCVKHEINNIYDNVPKAALSNRLLTTFNIVFVEIYNEKIHDLLTDSNNHESLRIREHPEDGPYVEGLTKLSLCDTKTLQTAINKSIKNRTIAANHVHEKSSRSHVICTIYYQEIRSGIDFPRTINSKLCLIDLAGSERVKTLNDRKRFTEGRKINLSLSSLSTVIGKLAEKSLTDNNDLELTLNSSNSTLNSARSSSTRRSNCYSAFHIPYRNSKLTWLLRDSLGGNARTTMIATISPSYRQYHETVNTLRYAQQAKMITNSPKVNEDESTIYIRQLLSEITALKQRLQEKETYSTIHRFLNYYPRSIKRRPLLRKSSSESSVNQYPFAENFDTSQYSKEEIRHCESERYPKHTPDILTTSYSEYKQICDLQISQNDVKQQQPITLDQTTQTNYSEKYGKLCVEYLQRSRIIDSSYYQLNSKLPFNDKSEHGDICVTTHSSMRVNQSNNLTNSLLNIHLSESNQPESKLFSNTKLTNQESQTDDGENNDNSNEKDETTEKLILAKPLAMADDSYINDDNDESDDQMKKVEKHASARDTHEASKELNKIRHNSITTTTTDISGVKMSLSESILTSTPKKSTPSKKLRMKKLDFRRTHRGLPVLTDTMCKKSKSHRKLSPVKKVGKRRVYFADGMSVIINNMSSTGKQLINDCQFNDEKLQPNQKQVEIGSPVQSDEFTDSLELSTDLKVSHDQTGNISMSINRTDDFSVEHKLNDTADEMKLDFSLLMTPVSTALQDLSSPSSYRTTASYLDDRSGRDDIAVATGEDLLEVPGGQQENRRIPYDSTDISLNLNDSLEAFESSDTNFDSTDSKEITKSVWFCPSVVEEVKEILQQRQSLSSPSSICSEDFYLDDHSVCDLNSNENCRQKIVYASNTLTRKKKCKHLVTNTEGKSPIISQKSQTTEETGSCEQNDDDDNDDDDNGGNEHKKDFSSQIQLEKYSLTEKRVNENISNGYLVHVSDKNKNNNHSNEIRYTMLKENSQTLESFNSLSCPIHQLMTSSSLTAKDIQSIMPTMNELIQADVLCSPSNRKLLDRLYIIHKSMQEVMQSNSQACILLLSINDRQNIYEGLITAGLADKSKLQPPKKPPLSSLELSEVLKILQNTRQKLLLSIQNTEQSDSNNDNSDSNTNSSSKIKLAEFDQIKATLLEVTKLIKSNDKLSLLKDTQYMSDSIEEVINSLENLNTVDISFEKDSELSSEIIEHLDDVINLNQKLIVTQGLEAIKENVLKQTNQRNNHYILQRQSAIDIVAALKLIEDDLYTSSIASNTTKDNKNSQQVCTADHLKYIHKSIAKQLTLDEKDSSDNSTILCLSADMNLLEDAFTKYCNKPNSHMKVSPKNESTININNTPTNYITYENTMNRFQDILSPISEHCTPETSAYETDTMSNESGVKLKTSKIKKILLPTYHQKNESKAYHSDDETQVLSICSKVQPENTSQNVSLASAVGVDYPDLSTFIDDTLGEHKETHSVSDNSSHTSYNLLSDQFRTESTFLIDSSIIAPIVSFLKSKILDNQSNIFREGEQHQKPEYTVNDVKKISNYLTNCLYENPEQPIPLTGTNYNLLNKLLTADQSTYTNMLKIQLDLCINIENPSHTYMATEETEAEDEEDGPVVNEELTFLINTLQDSENIVLNKPFIEQLCSVVSNYSLSILPDKYPSLLAVINSSDDAECFSNNNNSEQFKQELSSELKQLLEVLHIELQSENMIHRDGSMKEIVGYSFPRLPNDHIRSARPINFIQTVISLYILDLFCLLPNEMDQVIYLINIHKNFQSLVDYSESPSIHCSPVCTKLKSLFNLFSSHNTTPDSEIYRAINKMLPSIKVCVETTKHSDIFQKHIEDILNRTKHKLTSKQYYFVNGETDDIVCGILITLYVTLVKGTRNLNPHEIARTLSEFCDFYHSLVNSKCIKLFDNISQPLLSLISNILHTESVGEGKNDHHCLNLTDINSSIVQVVSECLTKLSEYKTMKFMQPLILLSLLLSQRRLSYEFTDFSSAEVNILLSILLLLRSNFQINLQNSLTMIMKNLANSLQNGNTAIPLHRDDYISQRLYSSISPLRSVALIHGNFDVHQGNSIVPYTTKIYSSNKLEVCTVFFDEGKCEQEFPVCISEQKSNSHNLFLQALTLREILNQPKTETMTNGLEIKPQYCRLLKSCLSEILSTSSSSSTVLPQEIVKSTHQIMQDIHLAEVSNHTYHMSEETLNKLIVYSNNLISHAKEDRINELNQTIDSLPDNNQVESNTVDTVDSIKTSIHSNLIVRIIDQELKPTTWFTLSHINKQVLECKTTIDEIKLLKDDSKIAENILQMPQSSSSSTADVCDQVILLAQLNQLKANLKNVVNQNEVCILNTDNAENLFCILEMIKNQTEIMESLEEEDKDFINSVKLDIIPNCIIHSTPLIMNSTSMVKIQQVLDNISSAELNTIQTRISKCFKDKQLMDNDDGNNNNNNQLASDLILGQLAVLSYSKELKISPKDFDSLRDYCVLFQQGNNENKQTNIPINFLSNLTTNNNANFSDAYPKTLHKDVLCIKLKRIQEFFNRIEINDEITNPISAYRLLVNTMELEYLARSHSLEIATIPESLKSSLISMLTTREKLFPYTLNEEESIHLKCLQKQLNYIINEMVDTSKVIHPSELTYHDYTCLTNEENTCETSIPLAEYECNTQQLVNTPFLSSTQLNILKTCEIVQCSSVENPLGNTKTEFINTSEECKEMNVVIEKFVNLSDNFRVFRSLTSKPFDNTIVESNQINNLATFISEVRLDEGLVNHLTPDEIQEIDEVYYKLLEHKMEKKAYSLSDVFNPCNLIQQNALNKITSHIAALETKAQQLLSAKVEKVNHLISVMSNPQDEVENYEEGKVKDEFYSSPELVEQDIDIETATFLRSTIQSYLELKQLPTMQTIPLVSLIENISSQVEMLDTEQCPTQRPMVKLSTSDLNQLSTVFAASKHQKLPETMILCTKVLNYKILFDIISYDIPICEIESRIVYCAFRDLNQVNKVMPSELLNNLEQRLRNYCHLSKIQQQQQPFVFSTAEIHSCKSLLAYCESEIKLEILQKLSHFSKLLMNQSGERFTENSEITVCKDIYYLVLMCLPNLSLNSVKYLRTITDLLVTPGFIHNTKNYAYCLKNLFSSYNILIMYKGASSLQELLEINVPMSVSEPSSSTSSSSSFSYLNTHYLLFFTNLLENFIDIKKLEQSLSPTDILLLVYLLQILQSAIIHEKKLKAHLKHFITRLLFNFITNQSTFIDEYNKHLINDLCKHVKWISDRQRVKLFTEGLNSLNTIRNDNNDFSTKHHCQQVSRCLQLILFNPLQGLINPLKAKQIACIIDNFNQSTCNPLRYPFIFELIEQTLNNFGNDNENLQSTNSPSTYIPYIFQCILMMESYFNKKLNESSSFQMINREDAAVMCVSLAYLVNRNIEVINNLIDNDSEDNTFTISSTNSWIKLLLLRMWYTFVACSQSHQHYQHSYRHSPFALELLKLEQNEIKWLIDYWKPRLELYSQIKRTVSIRELSISTECDLTAEMTNQQLRNAICLSLLNKQMNGPRNAWICINFLKELQSECEQEFISISNFEKEALRLALCSANMKPSETIANTDIIASVVCLNSLLSRMSSTTISLSTSFELPELFLIQPTDAAAFASSIQNILRYTYPDVHKPYSFYLLNDIECHLWISSANMEKLWISKFEFRLISELKQKASEYLMKSIRHELINILNECDERNLIKPNLTCLSIETTKRKNLAQLLRTFMLLNHYPLSHTINILHHLQLLHDMSSPYISVQTVSYLRSLISSSMPNENPLLQYNQYDSLLGDNTTFRTNCTSHTLDSCLINYLFAKDQFCQNLPGDIITIIQTSTVYSCTCEEIINSWSMLPKHSYERLNSCIYELFCLNLNMFANHLLKVVITNDEEFSEANVNISRSIPLILCFLKYVLLEDTEKHSKSIELQKSVIRHNISVKLTSSENIYTLNDRLKQLLDKPLNQLSVFDLIQAIIDSEQFQHKLMFSKLFHEDLEYIPHLQYYLCNKLVSELCKYSTTLDKEYTPQVHQCQQLGITYEETAKKLKENINNIYINLSIDGSNKTQMCPLRIDPMKSACEYVHENDADDDAVEIKSDTISDTLINFTTCETVLYPVEDVRPEINRLNHLLAINTLQPDEMSAILSSIVVLRDASMRLPPGLKDYTHFSTKEEDALKKLQSLIDKRMILKLDKQLKTTLWMLSQRLGLLAIQANKDLLRTGLEIWLTASLENEFIFSKQQIQQIYYALCLADNINNENYSLQTDFSNTFDLVQKVIVQLNSIVNAKVGAEIEGPHSLGPIITLFLEHAQQLLEQVTFSEFLSNAHMISTNGIPSSLFVKQKTTAENLWKRITCQSPEVVEDTLKYFSQSQKSHSPETECHNEQPSMQTNTKRYRTLRKHPEIDEYDRQQIRQSYSRSLSYGKTENFQLNSPASCDGSLSLLALYNDEKRRLADWEETTETRLRKACERVEKLLETLPEKTHPQQENDHIITQLRGEVVQLKGQLNSVINQKTFREDSWYTQQNKNNSPHVYKEQCKSLRESPQLFTQERQFTFRDNFGFDSIQKSERYASTMYTPLSDRLASSTSSLKNIPSFRKRYINENYSVSCKPVTPDHTITSPPSTSEKRILQSSFDRLQELIEIRRAVVAGSREELSKLGIHSNLPKTFPKPVKLLRSNNKSVILPDSRINTAHNYDKWFSNNQRNIDRQKNYTSHLCRSEDEYSRSNQVIEDLEDKLEQLEEQILPHRINDSLVH